MYSNKKKKLVRVTLESTLLVTIILSMFTPSVNTTEWSPLPDIRLTWDTNFDWAPSMTQDSDGRIWIVWRSSKLGENEDIVYKVYDESATFPWSSINKLTTDLGNDRMPSITTMTDNNTWVVWSSNRDGNYEIYYKIYNYTTKEWHDDIRLTENASVDEFPSIMQDEDDDIWVVWSSNRDGNYEIYYKIYNYTTKEWYPEELLISNPAMDWDPSIMQAQDGKIWLVWVRDSDMFHRVFFKNGPVVMDDMALTNNETTPRSSIMQAQDGKIWIAWESNRPQVSLAPDIYCRIIGNGSSEERITYDNADDVTPAIMQTADGTIWIAWTSSRLDNFDIYYKTDSPPQYAHDIAILSVTHSPNKTEIRRGLNVSIEVVPQNQGMETDEFTVSYYVNSTQMESQNISLSAGQVMPVKFIWETSGIAPGIYTITAEVNAVQNETDTADNTFINGAVLVRIPGDADLNGWVELDDYDIWIDNFGKKSHRCPPGLYPDFNNDGLVDMLDFFVWRENFGAH